MARLDLRLVGSDVTETLSADVRQERASQMGDLDQSLSEKKAVVRAGWGPSYVERIHAKGKWTVWQRLDALRDADTAMFEVGTLVNWGRAFDGSKRAAPGAGVVTCFARVADRWVVVIANDNTVASGAWWPRTPEKIQRAQRMAERLRLPVVYLVDCSGLFLPEQSNSFSGRTGAGHIFAMNARLADAGVPQLAGVFGDCIAGGGYMPIISDRVVMTESAYMVIAGAALIKGAKALQLTSLDIGGPEVHAHHSGCADARVPNDATAVSWLRNEVSRLPTSANAFYRAGVLPEPPLRDPAHLPAIVPCDPRVVYPIEDVLGCLIDGSRFCEFLPHVGREMITGVARVSGLWVGFVANRQGMVDGPDGKKRPGGVLYREGVAKISAFTRACNDDGIPIVWLQDISGFDIGVQAEAQGLLGYGSSLIYANSTPTVPVFCILLRKASGAGYYAMSGMPYEPVIQLATPVTRLAVMEGRTLAIAAYNSKLDDDFEIATTDPDERLAIEKGMKDTAARIDNDMDPVRAASTMDTDEVVPVSDLRAWLECLVQSAWQAAGYRRTKNPRIWSLHDLRVLAGDAASLRGSVVAGRNGDALLAPTVGRWLARLPLGTPVVPGLPLGVIEQSGSLLTVVAPDGIGGVVTEGATDGDELAFGSLLIRLGEHAAAEASVDAPQPADTALPDGVVAVEAETDGMVYLRPSPEAPLFVDDGSRVTRGDSLALVEVMKMYTPVLAPVDGTVVSVRIGDGEAVASGQALFWIRPG